MLDFVLSHGSGVLFATSGFLLGLLGVIVLAAIEYGAWALVLPPRDRGDRKRAVGWPEGEAAEHGEAISAQAGDGARLAGLWHPASTGGPTGKTAILLHGFAEASGELQAQRVAALNRAGWNVTSVDLRGYGKSEGPFSSFGGREGADIRSWIDALAERAGPTSTLRPVLWGRSMGAAIAIRAAAIDSRVVALVLESPMVNLDDAMAAWFRKRRAPFPGLMARLVTRRAGTLAGVSLTRPQPLDLAPRVNCPVLIVHGADDGLVSARDARGLAAAFPSPAAMIEVPGAGHTDVIAVGGQPVLDHVVRFLRNSIPAAG